jgi:hypothetical protein
MGKIQKLSHSARETLETCGYKYELHYEKRYRSILTSSALLFGNAYDEALNILLLERNLEKAKQAFIDNWLQHEQNFNIDYYKSDLMLEIVDDEVQWDIAGVTDANKRAHYEHFFSMEAKGLKMLEAYAEHILPKIIRVIAVQKEFQIPFPKQGGLVRGIIDLIAEIQLPDGSIVAAILDNKSTSAPYPKNSFKTKEQTALYNAAYPEYKFVGFLTINKKDFSTQIIVGEPPPELIAETLEKFSKAFTKISKRSFAKNKKGCFAFGKKCPFYSHCFGSGFGADIYEKVDENE